MSDHQKCRRQYSSDLSRQRSQVARQMLNLHRFWIHRSSRALQRPIGLLADPGVESWFEGVFDDKPEDDLIHAAR